jgi:tetratricopeptide (TPR) repeat protein
MQKRMISVAMVMALAATFLAGFVSEGLLEAADADKTYKEITKRGKGVLEAAYKYRNDTGLFPDLLENLVPTYLKQKELYYDGKLPRVSGDASDNEGIAAPPLIEEGKWNYLHEYEKGFLFYPPTAAYPEGMGEKCIVFYRHGPDRGWFVCEGNFAGGVTKERKLRFSEPRISESKLTAEELTARKLEELDRRIEKEYNRERVEQIKKAGVPFGRYRLYSPRLEALAKSKVSLLVQSGRLQEARALCFSCLDDFVYKFSEWPWVAIGKIDRALEQPRQSAANMVALYDKLQKRSFPSAGVYYNIFCYYRETWDKKEAIGTLEGLAEVTAADKRILRWYDVVLYPYHMKEYDLALKLCDEWETVITSANKQGSAKLPQELYDVRSACYLAMGETKKARDASRRAASALPGYIYYPEAEGLKLRQAIKAGNAEFVYFPDYEPDFFRTNILYQLLNFGKEKTPFFFDPQ